MDLQEIINAIQAFVETTSTPILLLILAAIFAVLHHITKKNLWNILVVICFALEVFCYQYWIDLFADYLEKIDVPSFFPSSAVSTSEPNASEHSGPEYTIPNSPTFGTEAGEPVRTDIAGPVKEG